MGERLHWTYRASDKRWTLRTHGGFAVAALTLCRSPGYAGFWLGHTGADAKNHFIRGGLLRAQQLMTRHALAETPDHG